MARRALLSPWIAIIKEVNSVPNLTKKEVELLEYYFDTPWGPPQGIFDALKERFPGLGISWFYDEPGNMIAGYLNNRE